MKFLLFLAVLLTGCATASPARVAVNIKNGQVLKEFCTRIEKKMMDDMNISVSASEGLFLKNTEIRIHAFNSDKNITTVIDGIDACTESKTIMVDDHERVEMTMEEFQTRMQFEEGFKDTVADWWTI